MKADAYPVYKGATGRICKSPVYWKALVVEDGKSIWSDGGWQSKKVALLIANNWIKSKQEREAQ